MENFFALSISSSFLDESFTFDGILLSLLLADICTDMVSVESNLMTLLFTNHDTLFQDKVLKYNSRY